MSNDKRGRTIFGEKKSFLVKTVKRLGTWRPPVLVHFSHPAAPGFGAGSFQAAAWPGCLLSHPALPWISVVDPTTLNLDPDPKFWTNSDPNKFDFEK